MQSLNDMGTKMTNQTANKSIDYLSHQHEDFIVTS